MYVESKTLFPSAQRTTAVANSPSADADIFHGMWRKAIVVISLTASGGVAGDTLSGYVDVLGPDGTWLNAGRFTTIAGDSAAIKHYMVLDATQVAATTFDVTADCAAGVTKPYLWGTKVRGRYTLVDAGAHGQNVTFSMKAYFIK